MSDLMNASWKKRKIKVVDDKIQVEPFPPEDFEAGWKAGIRACLKEMNIYDSEMLRHVEKEIKKKIL